MEFVLHKDIKSNRHPPLCHPKIKGETLIRKRRWATCEAYRNHQTYKSAMRRKQSNKRYLFERSSERNIKTQPKAYYTYVKCKKKNQRTCRCTRKTGRRSSADRIRKLNVLAETSQGIFHLPDEAYVNLGNPETAQITNIRNLLHQKNKPWHS